MILVTGSTGQFGKATIDFLLEKIPATGIAALARDKSKAAGLTARGIDVRIGDYTDSNSMVSAFRGVDKLFLISSNDMNDRAGQHINAINAAKEAGVKHIIYTSTHIKDMMHSAIAFITEGHVKTSDHLKSSGITFTLMNNTLYADVLPMFLGEKILETGIFFPAGDGRVPYATRLDMAEAAANVLSSAGHENMEYAIASGVSYSIADVAGILSGLSGKQVNYTDPSPETFVEQLIKAGVPEMYAGFSASFAEAIKRDEFNLPDNTLEKLLGRKPVSLEAYLETAYFSKKQ